MLIVITGVNPSEVDILMGTFTKSFGSVGGYIAGDKVELVMQELDMSKNLVSHHGQLAEPYSVSPTDLLRQRLRR